MIDGISVFEYKTVKDLGFERIEMDDNVFFNQHGYKCFFLKLDLSNKIRLEWDCQTRLIEMIRIAHNNMGVLGRLTIKNSEELNMFIDFFKRTK